MAVGDSYVFPGFLTPVQTQLFFPKPPTTFLTCFCRGERRKYTGSKSCLNRRWVRNYIITHRNTGKICLYSYPKDNGISFLHKPPVCSFAMVHTLPPVPAETSPHSSVVRALDLKTRGCGFDSRADQPAITNCLPDETEPRSRVTALYTEHVNPLPRNAAF